MIALDLVTRQTIAVILGLIGKKFEVKEAKKEKEQGDQGQDPKLDLKERREEGAQAIALGQATTQGQTSTGIGENDQGKIRYNFEYNLGAISKLPFCSVNPVYLLFLSIKFVQNLTDLTLEALPIQVAEALLRQARHPQDLFTGNNILKNR